MSGQPNPSGEDSAQAAPKIRAVPIPFDPHRFRTAAESYARGRLNYPAELIARVVLLAGLKETHRVMDLGCGPGFLAVAFAPYAREVVGVDPEPAMLEQAAQYAAQSRARIQWVLGSSFDLGEDLGRFQLVTMGRSFHWMDRPATLETLSKLVSDNGAVALFGDAHLDMPTNHWKKRFEEVLKPFAEKDPSHGGHRRGNPSWLPHEAVLLDSKFNHLERISVVRQIETPVERLVDRALSMSSTSPQRLGAELGRLMERLRAALSEEAKDGVITEVVESEALLAFRH